MMLVFLWTFVSLLTVVSGCFPFDTKFNITNTTIQVPNVTRDQWWCSAERFYGWLG